MRKAYIISICVALFACPAVADEGYLYIKGSKQGEIKGDSMQKGRENLNKVVAFEYSTGVTPTAGFGMASGKRQRPNAVFTLEWSKATPLLINAAVMNESMSVIRYDNYAANRFMGAAGSGIQSLSDTIEFNNARILGVEISDNNGNAPNIDPLVKVTISYQSVTITHADGSIVAMDDNGGQQ